MTRLRPLGEDIWRSLDASKGAPFAMRGGTRKRISVTQRFVEAMWFGTSAMFVTLGVAPRFGVPVSKEIYAIVFWFFLVPVFLGYILAFVVTEIEPGNHALLSIPASLRAPWATCTRCDRRQVPVRSQRHLPRSLHRGFPSLLQAR